MKDRVYIFLDKSISNPQKTVQSAHLGMESIRHFSCEVHPSVIVLAINLNEIEKIKEYLSKKGIRFVEFFEPLFDKISGISTEPISKETSKVLQHYSTIKDRDFIQPIVVEPRRSHTVDLSPEEEAIFEELMVIEKKLGDE